MDSTVLVDLCGSQTGHLNFSFPLQVFPETFLDFPDFLRSSDTYTSPVTSTDPFRTHVELASTNRL